MLITTLETSKLLQLCFCAVGVGMAKTGLGGLGLLVVPIMAGIFGAKASTGILLIILGVIFIVAFLNIFNEPLFY